MIGAATLNRLLAKAGEGESEEAAFFQALMKANVFAHAPVDDPASRAIRFIQFSDPETGQLLLPFFTDRPEAQACVGTTRKIVTVQGRQFLEATRGATLILNPNDQHCILYPEEVGALLQTGHLARIDKTEVQAESEPLVGAPNAVPGWLMDLLAGTLARLPFIDIAYVASLQASEGAMPATTLLAIGTPISLGERAVRAVITAIQPECRLHRYNLDITGFVEPSERPDWIQELKLAPIYEKTPTTTHSGSR